MCIRDRGSDYRFPTDFYQTSDKSLVVKGFGDPSLVSEEIEKIANTISKKISLVRDIILDRSYFASNLTLDGSVDSNNPYDAENGALIANFNTIYIKRLNNGKLVSAEPQTPLVPLAHKLSKIKNGTKKRINLGQDPNLSTIYFGPVSYTHLTLPTICSV